MRISARRLLRSEDGATGVLFGLLTVPVITLMGAAIDYGRAMHLKEQLQRIADAATIAGLNEYYKSGNAQKAESLIVAYIDSGLKNNGLKRGSPNQPGAIIVSNTQINPTNSTAQPKLESKMKTIVLGLIGVETMDIEAQTKVAVASATQQGTKALELSLVLDVSGSMQGQKIADLKSASKDFLDIVMPNDLAADNRKIGLIPFSAKVNAGQFAPIATNLAPTKQIQNGTTTVYALSNSSFSWRSLSQCGDRVQSVTAYASYTQAQAETHCRTNFTYDSGRNKYWTPSLVSTQVPKMETRKLVSCVTERQGGQAYTDASPSTSPVGWYAPSSSESSQYSTTGKCMMYANELEANAELPEIKALTTDKDALKDHIDSFNTYGGTAGHLATAWSYYMLSPLWNSVWPESSQVADYSEQDTVKAAVIMTDGEYNSAIAATSASQQALAVCGEMKDRGIKVYTIGFDMDTNSAAAELLRQCASPGSYYFPYDGNALRTAFQEIGNALVNIVTTSSDNSKVIVQQ